MSRIKPISLHTFPPAHGHWSWLRDLSPLELSSARHSLRALNRALVAWDVGTLFYLVLAGAMIVRSSVDNMRCRTRVQDDGAIGASLAVVVLEPVRSKSSMVQDQGSHLGWRRSPPSARGYSSHTAFAIHYAHDYYGTLSHGATPARFPHQSEPSYWDFPHFSLAAGTTSQPPMGRLLPAASVSRCCRLRSSVLLQHYPARLTINIVARLI